MMMMMMIMVTVTSTVSQVTSDSCNETLCASIVTKCQLLQRCNCDSNTVDVTCTQECFKCLDFLYIPCCSCVNLCPQVNMTHTALLSSLSHVEDLPEPMPLLFSTITEEDDTLKRWTLEKFPVTMNFVTIDDHGEIETTVYYPIRNKITSGSSLSNGVDKDDDETVDCTVVYMATCMSLNKCKISCTYMGASAYRWFHDACCQCIGPRCINYGMNTSKCLMCPKHKTAEDEENVSTDAIQVTSSVTNDHDDIFSHESAGQLIPDETASGGDESDDASSTMTSDIETP